MGDAPAGWTPVNTAYRAWLTSTFGAVIPTTAAEIVPRPAELGDEDSGDAFCDWINAINDG